MERKIELSEGYTISRVINGCWQLSKGHTIHGTLDMKDVMKAFHMLAEKGFTTFDCGDIYVGVEEFLGEFIQELKDGDGISPYDIQIHTKFVPDLDMLSKVDFTYVERIVDRSLMRLKVDTLDMVQFHWWDYDVPGCLETAGYLCRLKEKGKIRNISVTNFDTKHLAELIDAGIPVVSCQSQYSVFDRRVEKQLLEYCRDHHIALFCYGTLSGGFLAEKWIGQNMGNPETRSQVKYLQVIEDSLGWEGYQQLLLLLKRIAESHEVGISQVASQYILQQPGVAATIIGVRNSRHVEDNARIFDFDLTNSEIAEIRKFLDQYNEIPGEPYELERTDGSKYRSIIQMNLNE